MHDKNGFFTSDQNISQNSLLRPSFPGDLSLDIIFKAPISSLSVILWCIFHISEIVHQTIEDI